MKFPILGAFVCVAILGLSACGKKPPMPLDLSAHYQDVYAPSSTPGDIVGEQVFDGVPLHVKGRAALYGVQESQSSGKIRTHYPDITGIKVERKFDELHLLHTTRWPDADGTTIARVRLHYADGSTRELDIGYGVHVRDWQRLQSEEREALADASSKVVWRGAGIAKYKASQRMFKSVLLNPQPSKRVSSIDFISTGMQASYSLYAATVADADPGRSVSAAVPLDRPEWNFNGRLHVRVLDMQGNPVDGALVDTSLSVPSTGWATSGSPCYTSAEGTGIVRYPRDRTEIVLLRVEKEGWLSASRQVLVSNEANPEQGVEVTIRLTPEP